MSRRTLVLSSVVLAALAASSFAASEKLGIPGAKATPVFGGRESVVVDTNLGTLAGGTYNLTGTTVGMSNDVDTYAPGANPAAIWDQDYTYQFTTASPFSISFTSNDPDSGSADNDFWLLNSTTTTVNANGLNEAQQIGPTAFINGAYGVQPAGTYYFSIDAWRGNPTVAGTPAAGRATAFNVQLSLSAPPVAFYSGELTTSDPSFARPTAGNPPTSTSSNVTFYDVVPFYVTATGLYTFEQGNSSFDDFMVIYTSVPNAANSLLGALEADDDDGDGTNALITRTFTAGVQYYLVPTSFFAGDTGTYDIFVTNPTAGSAVLGIVPEPTTLAAIAGLGVLLGRRRRA